jgi:bifunctional DNA-binding transcriptional regulator/antitoxin component of YhaV-PrlF toxin-antitoxin module
MSEPKVYRARITDEWLPFPAELLAELGWKEGDEINVDIAGDVLVLTKVGEAERRVVVRKAPSKRASIQST